MKGENLKALNHITTGYKKPHVSGFIDQGSCLAFIFTSLCRYYESPKAVKVLMAEPWQMSKSPVCWPRSQPFNTGSEDGENHESHSLSLCFTVPRTDAEVVSSKRICSEILGHVQPQWNSWTLPNMGSPREVQVPGTLCPSSRAGEYCAQ